MKIHDLKVWPVHFAALWSRAKTFEVRKNDRDYEVGDILHLREYSERDGYTGREVMRLVTHILPGGDHGIKSGYVVLSLGLVG